MILGYAKPFSNGYEYMSFNERYCCNCKRYKVNSYEGEELTAKEGGCPIAEEKEE